MELSSLADANILKKERVDKTIRLPFNHFNLSIHESGNWLWLLQEMDEIRFMCTFVINNTFDNVLLPVLRMSGNCSNWCSVSTQ